MIAKMSRAMREALQALEMGRAGIRRGEATSRAIARRALKRTYGKSRATELKAVQS